MLKDKFIDQTEFSIYLSEQKIRGEKGYLSCSERNQLKSMSEKTYKPIFIKEEKPKLPIVTNYAELKKPCQLVTKEDNVKEIVQRLKDTFNCCDGYGLSANQIGINKRVSYVKIPKIEDKKLAYTELVLINAAFSDLALPIKVQNEGCLSFPNLYVTTKRYGFCIVQYLDENLKEQTGIFKDTVAVVIQHEVDHQRGILFINRKFRAH